MARAQILVIVLFGAGCAKSDGLGVVRDAFDTVSAAPRPCRAPSYVRIAKGDAVTYDRDATRVSITYRRATPLDPAGTAEVYVLPVDASGNLIGVQADLTPDDAHCITCDPLELPEVFNRNPITGAPWRRHKSFAVFHPNGKLLLMYVENERGSHSFANNGPVGTDVDFWAVDLSQPPGPGRWFRLTWWGTTSASAGTSPLLIDHARTAIQALRIDGEGARVYWGQRCDPDGKDPYWPLGQCDPGSMADGQAFRLVTDVGVELGQWDLRQAPLIASCGSICTSVVLGAPATAKPAGDGYYETNDLSPDGATLYFSFSPYEPGFHLTDSSQLATDLMKASFPAMTGALKVTNTSAYVEDTGSPYGYGWPHEEIAGVSPSGGKLTALVGYADIRPSNFIPAGRTELYLMNPGTNNPPKVRITSFNDPESPGRFTGDDGRFRTSKTQRSDWNPIDGSKVLFGQVSTPCDPYELSPSGQSCAERASLGDCTRGIAPIDPATGSAQCDFDRYSCCDLETSQCAICRNYQRDPAYLYRLDFSGACGDARYVFVTSAVYDGDLGGLRGADAKCQARADAAKLGGKFRAWLSDGAIEARSRIDAKGPYVRTDGEPVAADLGDLLAATLENPLSINEYGSPITVDLVAWTGTSPSGARIAPSCSSWTRNQVLDYGVAGATDSTASRWTDDQNRSCSTLRRLYCFQVAD
jgi:hypothetical protein